MFWIMTGDDVRSPAAARPPLRGRFLRPASLATKTVVLLLLLSFAVPHSPKVLRCEAAFVAAPPVRPDAFASSPAALGTTTALRAGPFGGGGDGDSPLDRGFNLLETAGKIIPQGRLVKTAKEGWKFAWTRMMAELAPQDKTGAYRRPSYSFTGRIGDADFPDEPGRYQLYVGNPCPWCHRAVLAAAVRSAAPSEVGITRLIDDPTRASRGGWIFGTSSRSRDPLFGCSDLRELYDRLSPDAGGFRGRCTAPLLVDGKGRRIVSNESSDIVRMLGKATFGDGSKERTELYPAELAGEIDATNEWAYRLLNNGVYRCGFATTQAAYDAASADVREGLRRCEAALSESPYLCGDVFTEADLRLLPTALRFDGAYGPLFRAGGAHVRMRDYPSLHLWMRRCWEDVPGVKGSIDIADACSSYYRQLFPLNPGGIVPTPVTAEDIGLTR